MHSRFIALFGLSLAFAICSCSDAEDVVTTAPDCASVCDRYQDCVDDDYDVVGCTQDCTDAAIGDEEFQNRIEECDDCIERTCTEAAFACAAECLGIVP